MIFGKFYNFPTYGKLINLEVRFDGFKGEHQGRVTQYSTCPGEDRHSASVNVGHM